MGGCWTKKISCKCHRSHVSAGQRLQTNTFPFSHYIGWEIETESRRERDGLGSPGTVRAECLVEVCHRNDKEACDVDRAIRYH